MLYATTSAIIKQQRNLHSTVFPALHGLYSGTRESGYATGVGFDAEVAAAGEFVERYAFRWAPMYEKSLPLRDFRGGKGEVLENIARSFSPSIAIESLKDRRFESCSAIDIREGSVVDVPLGLVHLGTCKDREVFPGADSTGCAVHRTLERAVLNSALELVERQCAMATWLGPWTVERIRVNLALLEARELAVLSLCARFGEVTFCSISDFECFCVMAALHSDETRESTVNFAVGFGTALNPREAFRKAVFELFQLIDHTLSVAEGRSGDERVDKRNNCESWQRVGAVVSREVDLDRFFASASFSPQQLLSSIEVYAERLWLYSLPISVGQVELFATKLFSPDMFISCLARDGNWDNRFSRKRGLNFSRASREVNPFF